MGDQDQAWKQAADDDKIVQLANLSDDEIIGEIRKIPDHQKRAQLYRRIKAQKQRWSANLAKAEAEEKKLPHNTAAEKGASTTAGIPGHATKNPDDDEMITETTDPIKHKVSGKAADLSVADTATQTTTVVEGDVTKKMDTSVKGSVGVSGASLGGERANETRVGEEKDGFAVKNTKSLDAGVDSNKGSAEVKGGMEKEVKYGDQVKTSGKTAGLVYEDGNFAATGALKNEEKTVDAEGNTTGAKGSDVSGKISKEGAALDYTRTKTNDKGTQTGVGGGAEVNWETGSMSATGNASVKTKGGNEAHGSVTAGVDVQADEPKQVGDHWEVSYKKITHSVGASGGASGTYGGGSVGGKEETFDFGTRSFKDEKEAKEFKEHAKEKLKDAPSVDSADGAMKLAVGETRGAGAGISGNAGASGSVEGAKASISGHAGMSDKFTVLRVSENLFQVSYKHESEKGLDGSVGGGPITTSAGESSSKGHTVTFEFDLGTKEGKQAFEQFQRDGKAPASGAKKISTEDEKQKEKHDGTKIAGLGEAKYGSFVKTDEVKDDKGDHKKIEGGQNHGVAPSKIGKKIFGDDEVHSSVAVEGRLEDGKDDGYTVTGKVSGESGKYNRGKMQALSSGLVEHENWDESKATASGEWTMTADLDKKSMHSLERYSDRFKGKSREDQMIALGEWMADDGSKAVQSIERWSGKALNWDLELKGDKNFPGRSGRLALEAKVKHLSDQLAKDPAGSASVVGTVDGEIAALKERRTAVENKDHVKYKDLPEGLQAQQLKLIDHHISDFQSLRHRALMEADKNKPGETANQIGARQGQQANVPADQQPLFQLRDKIALADAAIAGYQKQNSDAIAAMKHALQHVDWSKRSGARIAKDSDRATTQAAAKDASQRAAYGNLDGERAALLQNASNPAAAMPIAQKLAADLQHQSDTLGEAQTQLFTAAMKQILVTKPAGLAGHEAFWKEIGESMDTEDYLEDEDVTAPSAAADDDPDPPAKPTSMSLKH